MARFVKVLDGAYVKRGVAVILYLLWQAVLLQAVSAATLGEVGIQVFADGLVHFKAIVDVDEMEASTTLPILAPSDRVLNVIVTDENGIPLSYDLGVWNITVYSLGAGTIAIEYDTDYLTVYENGLWTLRLEAPLELNVTLPEGSEIVYINAAPLSLANDGNTCSLRLYPGQWEISYTISAPTAQLPAKPGQQTEKSENGQIDTRASLPIAWITAIGILIVAIITAYTWHVKHRRAGSS